MKELLDYLEFVQLKAYIAYCKSKNREKKERLKGEIKALQVAIDYIENYLEGGLG